MNKSLYKKRTGKSYSLVWDLLDCPYIPASSQNKKWLKSSLNRTYRHKAKEYLKKNSEIELKEVKE